MSANGRPISSPAPPASDILRAKYLASQLQKTAQAKTHPTLDDIGGIDHLRPHITDKLHRPLFFPEHFHRLGTSPPRSLLIHGIAGVGKTFLVHAFCQQHRLPLLSAPLESPRDVKELFSKAKAAGRAVLLIDDADTIEEKSVAKQINASLAEFSCNALVVLTARTIPEDIRFDNDIFIRIPTADGRRAILQGLLRGVRAEAVDVQALVDQTPGFVPGALARLLTLATTRALGRLAARPAGDAEGTAGPGLATADFLAGIRELRSTLSHAACVDAAVTFNDIGAMEAVKEELTMSILLPSLHPQRFARLGIAKPSGVLLYGPPGCGKTLIAKAVSHMSHCNFLSIKGPELITKYVGDSEKHLRDLFQKAKNLSPCVLFFDEIDSLCGRRGRNEFGARIVNQILTLLDGMDDRGEVYLIGATNRLERLDAALLRPGRFDKLVEVPLPTAGEARVIFEKCLAGVPSRGVDGEALVLEGLSGADIAGVVKEAAMLCLRENFEAEDACVERRHVDAALEKLRGMKRRAKLL